MKYAVPSQQGKYFFITGANTGIGRVTALELARAGAHLTLACRSLERTQPVLDEIAALSPDAAARVRFLPLDLSDLDSVRACAESFLALDEPLDVLINNAGLAGQKGLTKQGYEIAFGVNHLGHFLLTMLLFEKLSERPDARVVNVASRAHMRVKTFDFEALRSEAKTATAFPEYSASKLANVWFSNELARRAEAEGVHVYALHPGVVASDVWREVPGVVRWVMKQFMISNEEGAMTTLYCATSPEVAAHTGRYYDACKEAKPTALARDTAQAARLWEESVKMTGASVPEALTR